MKRGTPDHFKVHDLARRLSLPRYSAVGLLEMLWHTTSKHTPAGDVGRLPDEQIAFYLGFEGSPKQMVDALVASRWLDQHPEHRLLIHDWPDHCDDATHMALARARKRFANGAAPKTQRLPNSERIAADAYYAGNLAVPTPEAASSHRDHGVTTPVAAVALPLPPPVPQPSPQPRPKPKNSSSAMPDAPPPDPLNTPAFLAAWKDYEAHRQEMKQKPLTPRSRHAKWREMAAWGHDAAITSIRNAIANGWRGLFQPSSRKDSHDHSASRFPDRASTGASVAHRIQRRAAECPEPSAPLPVWNS